MVEDTACDRQRRCYPRLNLRPLGQHHDSTLEVWTSLRLVSVKHGQGRNLVQKCESSIDFVLYESIREVTSIWYDDELATSPGQMVTCGRR